MCRFGVRAPAPASAGGGGRLVRKPTRWPSSSPEVLKRVCRRCHNEGLPQGDAQAHDHVVLQGRDAAGANLAAHAAVYPPALCTAILRGIAAQHAREGRPIPWHVQDRMNRGMAVFDLATGCGRPEAVSYTHLTLPTICSV
eukprot:12041868-Alexandrium_andersonii.AAC.1